VLDNCPSPTKPEGLCLYGCIGASLLALVLLFLCSFQGLPATSFALTRNSVTGVVHFDSIYHGGRNFIGFYNHYIEFPSTLQSIEWLDGRPPQGTRDLSPMQVRTSDGLMVTLGIVAQYRFVKDKLGDIYREFNKNIESYFISNLRSSIQETISTFRATELYENRVNVTNSLLQMCHDVCKGDLHGFLTCWRLDLLTVALDSKIESANIREQVEKQKQETERMIQNASLIRAETEVIVSDFQRQIQVIDATAAAKAYNITNQARAEAALAEQEARATALRVVQDTVTAGPVVMTQDQQLNYLEKLALIDDPKSAMVYGDFQTASVFYENSKPAVHEL